jgi:hypothetical protein
MDETNKRLSQKCESALIVHGLLSISLSYEKQLFQTSTLKEVQKLCDLMFPRLVVIRKMIYVFEEHGGHEIQ